MKKLSRDEMARRVAQDIPEGAYVNLGIGLPTRIANYLPTEKEIFLHSENGLLGMGPKPAEGDEDPELVREALYTLCALRRPLTRRAVSGRLSAMPPAERKALLRYVVAEGYSPGPLRRLLDERERPYYESLVQTYKRSLA